MNPAPFQDTMQYVYILKSMKTNMLYIGMTNNVEKRFASHNAGASSYTKKFLPWKLVYCEGYADTDDAMDRESKLKEFGKVYSQLKIRIRRSLQS